MRDERGVTSMSFGRISVQKSSTSFDLEKNRWPPMSKWKPLCFTVFEIPPTYLGSASRMETSAFFFVRRYAAVNPAGPVPMIATETLFSADMRKGSRLIRTKCHLQEF